ncbi:MAG TPA: glycosyltransferase, partial [Acidobacteriota bacterium]|nr:glycosyltransferase [Acidobacteriota bacterium]
MTSVLYYLLLLFLGVTSLGGLVYYLLAIFSIRRLRRLQPDTAVEATIPLPPISLLKPLNGADPGLELYLRTFFAQDYPQFEILFAVRHESDPAVPIVRNLMAEFSQIPARLILTGEPPFANAKVYSMELMARAARFDILVITDSDASVRKDYLRQMAKTFYPAEVGAMTNLYRGVGELDFWSKLEALGMSTEFMA